MTKLTDQELDAIRDWVRVGTRVDPVWTVARLLGHIGALEAELRKAKEAA